MLKPLSSLLSSGVALLAIMTTTIACTSQGENQSAEAQWQEVGLLPTSLESHKMLALNEFVYVLGGWNEPKGVHSEVFYTPLTPERKLDDWQETTAPMPLKLQHHEVLIYDNALYVLGGDNGFWENSTVSDRIFRAVPNAQGDITEWAEVGKLPEPLTIHAATILDDQVYILGGSRTFRPGGTTVNDAIYTATISSEGEFEEFQQLTPFPTAIGWVTATTVDRRIFAISGSVQFRPTQLTEQVWVADVDPNNQFTAFETIGMITPRQRHATVLVDRTLVVIAGGGANGALSIVEAAEIDPQGNLSAWTELPPLPEARYAHAAFAHDGYIYVSGGFLRYGSNDTSSQVFGLPLPE